MFKLRSALKYNPSNFNLFQKRGLGILWLAETSLQIAKGKFANANEWFDLIDQGKWDSSSTVKSPDLFSMYLNWTEADDMLRRLRAMPEEERKKHLALDSKIDYASVEREHEDLTGYIHAWERRHPDIVGARAEQATKRKRRRVEKTSRLGRSASGFGSSLSGRRRI